MSVSPAVQALASSLLFRDLPVESLARLSTPARRHTYRHGEVIFHQGDPGDTAHIVQTGRVKIVADADSGDEALLTVLGPGDWFGELALIDGEPRSARVEALDPVETLSLRRQDFLQFLGENPQVMEPLLRALAGTIRRLTETVGDLTSLDLEGRLAKRLLQLAEDYGRPVTGGTEIELTLTQEELAAMVGATRASVNKVLGSYQDRGVIERRGHHIAILDAARLRGRIV
jgi:CRP/FNR family cyclic AMP-dependent transcriptional regulator